MSFLDACVAWEADYIRQNQDVLEAQGNFVHVSEDVPGLDDLAQEEVQDELQEESPVIGSYRGEPVYPLEEEVPFDKWNEDAWCHVHAFGQLADGTIIYEDEVEDASYARRRV